MKKIIMASITFMLLLVVGCKFAATTIDRNQMAKLTAENNLNSNEIYANVMVVPTYGGSGADSFFELTFTYYEVSKRDGEKMIPAKLKKESVTTESFKLYNVKADPEAPFGTTVEKTVTVSLIAENKVKIVYDATGDTTGDYIVYADAQKVRFTNESLLMNGNQNTVAGEPTDSYLEAFGPNAETYNSYRRLSYLDPDASYDLSATGKKDETGAPCVVGSTTMRLTQYSLAIKPVETTLDNLKIQKWNYETARWDSVAATFAVKTTTAVGRPTVYDIIATVPAMAEKDLYRLVVDHPDKIQYETGVSDGVGLATISGPYMRGGYVQSISRDSVGVGVGAGVKSEYADLQTIVGGYDGLKFTVKQDPWGGSNYLQVTAKGDSSASLKKVMEVWNKIIAGLDSATRTVQFFSGSDFQGPAPFSINLDYQSWEDIDEILNTAQIFYPITSTANPSSSLDIYVSNNFKLPNTLAGDAYTAEVYPFTKRSPHPSDGSYFFPAKNWTLACSAQFQTMPEPEPPAPPSAP